MTPLPPLSAESCSVVQVAEKRTNATGVERLRLADGRGWISTTRMTAGPAFGGFGAGTPNLLLPVRG